MNKTGKGDRWVKNDMLFICDGNGYAVTRTGATVCIGPVDDDGNPLEDVLTAPISVSTAVDVVSKMDDKGIIPTEVFLKQKTRGRPRKNGDDISRATAWRRQQEEKQGALL